MHFTIDDTFGDLLRDICFENFLNKGFDYAYKTLEHSLMGSELTKELVSELLLGKKKFVVKDESLIVEDDNYADYVFRINFRLEENLKELYYRLRMTDKYDAINARINALD